MGMFNCTGLGWVVAIMACVSALMLIASSVFESEASPNGDVGVFYSVPVCHASSVTIAGRGAIEEYVMKPFTTTTGTACPAVANRSASPISITLEESDGYRVGASYNPVLVAPSGAYMYVTMSVVDRTGRVLMPESVVSLGPDEYYPWTVDTVASVGAATIAPASTSSSTSAVCSNTCRYDYDAACDDGGPGSEYSLCATGSDCADCGSRTTSRRSLEDGDDEGESSAGERRLLSFPVAFDGMDEEEEEDAMHAAPRVRAAARRLLKGGSSGGSSSGRSGSYSSSGSGRWGSSSSPTTRSVSSSRTTTYSSSGRTYGGRSSYYVGGRTYYASSSYSYRYGYRSYPAGTYFMIVGPWGYGCYSCSGYGRSCYSCSNCYNRYNCGGARDEALSGYQTAGFDRYEIALDVPVPASGDGAGWPLTLVISRADMWLPGAIPGGSGAVYVSMYTNAGDSAESLSGILSPIGFIGLMIAGFIACSSRGKLTHQDRDRTRAPRAFNYVASAPAPQPMHACGGMQMAAGGPPHMVAQPMQVQAQPSMPVAYGQAQPYPQQAYPQQAYPQQAYPQQAYPQQAYPQQAVPMAQAYPSNPASPPEPPSKSE